MVYLFFASLERLLELKSSRVPQELPWHIAGDAGANWPTQGEVEFCNTTLCYRPGLPPAVRDFSVSIKAAERLGIVGRTGAGKSSISVLLLRLVELSGGTVLIDKKDVS